MTLNITPEKSWISAALVADGVLSETKAFAPGAEIRVGTASSNEFVVPRYPSISRTLLTDGNLIHMMPGSELRMSDAQGNGFAVHHYVPQQPNVRVVVQKAVFNVHPGLSLFLQYFPTRAELEAFTPLE